jgi:hypothetical protein
MMTSAPVTFRSRLWRWTKRLALFTTVSVISIGAACYFGLPFLARQGCARVKVERAISKSLGSDLHVGDMAFSWRNGLTLREVSTTESENPWAPLASVETMKLKPDYKKLLKGKLRLNVLLERPEVVLTEGGSEAKPITFPRFTKHKVRIEKIEIRDGAYVVKSTKPGSPGAPSQIRIDNIATEGSARLENREFRLELKSVTGSVDGKPVSGRGVLRVTADGLGGELDVNDPANLGDALRPARVMIKKLPAMSEPM